jgi:prepilin-type N-terminal cleavage/methylation domain-containing protein/prepilin-type processing-associated H-X9-DG protein
MKSSAFSLIELLTVIAIIALLAGILIPVLSNSRHQAKSAVCASNIREILIGLHAYETDNQMFPYAFNDIKIGIPGGGFAGNASYDKLGWWWFNYLSNYFRKDKRHDEVVWCPARHINNLSLKDDILCGNYGINQSICKDSQGSVNRAEFIGSPLRLADIARPTATLFIVDSGYAKINWLFAADSPPVKFSSSIEDTSYVPGLAINKNRKLLPGQETDAVKGRHPSKTINTGFVDAHVSKLNASELLVQKNGNSYKNIQPLWRIK